MVGSSPTHYSFQNLLQAVGRYVKTKSVRIIRSRSTRVLYASVLNSRSMSINHGPGDIGIAFLMALSFSYLHFARGCVTPAQISNLKEGIEDNLEYLDGFEDIDEDMQEKVVKALENGHVADEDWKGV